MKLDKQTLKFTIHYRNQNVTCTCKRSYWSNKVYVYDCLTLFNNRIYIYSLEDKLDSIFMAEMEEVQLSLDVARFVNKYEVNN